MPTELHMPSLGPGLICTYGDLIEDQVVALRGPLEVNGLVEGTSATRPGGSSPNVATAVLRAGGEARFVGHCGTDETGNKLLAHLDALGLDVRPIRKGRTCTVFAMQLASGEAAMVHDPGGRWSVKPSDIQPEWFDGAAVIQLTGFNLLYEQCFHNCMEVVRIAKDIGAAISIDCGASNLMLDFGIDRFVGLLDEIQPELLLCNSREGEALGLPHFIPKSVNTIIWHRGPSPTKVYSGGTSFDVPTTPLKEAIDFVGAGDAFSGGFLAGWKAGLSTQAAVELAHKTAAQTLMAIHADSTVNDER